MFVYKNYRNFSRQIAQPSRVTVHRGCTVRSKKMKWLWIVLLLPSIVQSFFDKNVKYMPMGYEKEPKCPEIPPKKSKSSFNVWQFLATISLTSTIAANIVNNVNSNNNNNK